jgi:hypothetical protein
MGGQEPGDKLDFILTQKEWRREEGRRDALEIT